MYTGLLALQQQNLPLGGFAGLYMTAVCWALFLLQKPLQKLGKLNFVQFHVAQRKGKMMQKD